MPRCGATSGASTSSWPRPGRRSAFQRAALLEPDAVAGWVGLARAADLAGDAAVLEDASRTLAALDPPAAARLAAWLGSSTARPGEDVVEGPEA
jgi:hypothetical protein